MNYVWCVMVDTTLLIVIVTDNRRAVVCAVVRVQAPVCAAPRSALPLCIYYRMRFARIIIIHKERQEEERKIGRSPASIHHDHDLVHALFLHPGGICPSLQVCVHHDTTAYIKK